jgi:hypothetical protein
MGTVLMALITELLRQMNIDERGMEENPFLFLP